MNTVHERWTQLEAKEKKNIKQFCIACVDVTNPLTPHYICLCHVRKEEKEEWRGRGILAISKSLRTNCGKENIRFLRSSSFIHAEQSGLLFHTRFLLLCKNHHHHRVTLSESWTRSSFLHSKHSLTTWKRKPRHIHLWIMFSRFAPRSPLYFPISATQPKTLIGANHTSARFCSR